MIRAFFASHLRPLAKLSLASGAYLILALTLIWSGGPATARVHFGCANALLVALQLWGRAPSLPRTLVGGWLASTLASALMYMPLWPAVGFGVANMVEVGAAVLLVRGFKLRPDRELDDRFFLLSVATTVIFAPAGAALVGALVAQVAFAVTPAPTFISWWVDDSVGILIALPALLACTRRGLVSLLWGHRSRAFWLTVPLTTAFTVAALIHLDHPFIFVSIPLLFAAYRLGVFGTTLACGANVAVVFLLEAAQTLGWITPAKGLAHLAPHAVALYAASTIVGPQLMSLVIAQHRRALERLSQLTSRLQVMADNVPLYISQLDAEKRYLFVNRRYTELFRKPESEFIGRTPSDIFGEDFAWQLDPYMQRVLSGEPQQFEVTVPTGQQALVRFAPHFIDGKVAGFFGLTLDITDRKELESRLHEITNNVPALISYLDDQLICRFANRRFLDLWGVGASEVINHPSAEITGAHYDKQLRSGQLACLKGHRTTLEFQLDDGRTFDLTYVPHVVDGEVRGIYSLGVDITRRKEAEAMLFESMQQAQMMLESIGDAVIACDQQLNVTMMNPVAMDMTGWSEQEAIGEPFANIVQLIDAETGEPSNNPLKVAISENRIVALEANSALRRRDGTETAIEDSASPIHDRSGKVTGGIMVFHDVSTSRAMALKMSHLAQHDYLTDLPNRVLLQDRVSQALTALRPGMYGALLLLDLDHFKHINDSLGHSAGDNVLKVVARRLRHTVRPSDTVSRQGGDEFVILLNHLKDTSDIARVAEKIIQSIEQGIVLDNRLLHVSTSIGIASFPADSMDTKVLMKQADAALYHAKQSGRGRYSYFTPDMSEKADQRMAHEQALRWALQNNELFLVYQPKYHLPSGFITGVEALVRWRKEDHSVLMPDQFITLAEEVGLITQIDEWVMREACRQLRIWADAGYAVPLSVNVSLVQLDADRLVQTVKTVLNETGIDPDLLQIEFTESQMFSRKDETRDLLARLKGLGISLAVDDFGTGYSNLDSLASYDFDTIKIDRIFVSGLQSNRKHLAVVEAVIGMARALGYRLVAEGVETEEEATTLLNHDCNEMQGNLFSRPLSPEQCAALLQHRADAFIDFSSDENKGSAPPAAKHVLPK